MATNNIFEYEGGVTATINDDNSVTVEEENVIFRYHGFPGYEEARQFCLFAEFPPNPDFPPRDYSIWRERVKRSEKR